MEKLWKICTVCGTTKELDGFYNHASGKHGKHSQCKDCRKSAERSRYAENSSEILEQQKSKDRVDRERERYFFNKYGLSLEEIQLMIAIQDHKCAICKKKTDLVVDHCHSTDVVRGMLCQKCNRALGQFDDDVSILASAIVYLTGKIA